MRWSTTMAVGVVAALGAACASGDEVVDAPTTTQPADVTVETTAAPPSTTDGASTTTSPSTTSTTVATSTTVPSTPVDPMFTPAGARLAAVGVPFDDPLAVRALPGDEQPSVAVLAPLADGIVSTGRAQNLGVGATWLEVVVDGHVGWLPLRNLLYLSSGRDATDRFVELIGRVPIAPSMLELGQLVGESIAATDFEVPTRIVAVTEPFDGAIGEVTIDVLDLPDDSVGGQRLRITGRALLDAETTGTGTAGYELVGVEATPLCIRGTSADGLCP